MTFPIDADTTDKPKTSKKPKTRKRPVCEVVEEIPARCPRCGSTERTQFEGTLQRNIGGKTREGDRFTHCRWGYCSCKECGHRYRTIRRLCKGNGKP